MNDWALLLLRSLHVVAGLFWVGAAVLLAGFIEPVARSMGPAGGQFMHGLVDRRRLPIFMELATILTIGTGVALYWRASVGLQWAWVLTGPGLAFAVAGLAATAAGLLGQFVNAPTAARIATLAKELAGGTPATTVIAEMERLQSRLRRSMQVGAVLLVAAAAGMAIARYLYVAV